MYGQMMMNCIIQLPSLANGKIKIGWEPVAGADSYEIARAGSRLGRYKILGTVIKTSFTDNSPNQNKLENYYKITAKRNKAIICEQLTSFELALFGANMKFYDSRYDKMPDIKNEINGIHDHEMFGGATESDGRTGEFSNKRYALYFKPGAYKDFDRLRIGFYTHASGLGMVPAQTKLSGTIETPPHLGNNNSTCTFWRSIENMEINCGRFDWAVSQAAPVRRMKVKVPAQFDWCGGWASGGFSADSSFSKDAGSQTQQQWYARNSHFAKGFYGVSWNKVIQGCTGLIKASDLETGGCNTTVDTTPVIREKPFLYLDEDEYKVFVPALRMDAAGVSWTDTNMGSGYSLSIEKDFHVAKEGIDAAAAINAALDLGKHIFFTPGRYYLDTPIHIKKPGTVVLGTGYATLIPSPENRYGALFVDDVENVTIAGIMFDALYSSLYLLCIGGTGTNKDHSHAPTLLADIFIRVGGYKEENVHVDIAVLINSNDVIGDHFWIWRADHGMGVGWDKNTSRNGVVVTGDRVTFYGLFVEHFHEYQTLWLGDHGRTFFYQSETPYDPFFQSVYQSHNGTTDGWAAYKAANNVNNHLAVGLGIYAVFNRTGPDRQKSESMFLQNAIEVPDKPGVTIQYAVIVEISGRDTAAVQTGIRSIVNGTGASVGGKLGRETLISYNDGVGVCKSGSAMGIQPTDEIFDIPNILLP